MVVKAPHKLLYSMNGVIVNSLSVLKYGDTLLMKYAREGSVAIVRRLAKGGAKKLNMNNEVCIFAYLVLYCEHF